MPKPDCDQLLAAICRGEGEAQKFCRAFVDWVDWLDDVIDQDAEWTPEQVVQVNLTALLEFADNPFFQKHRLVLLPLIVQGANAFLDSEEWARRESVQDRRAADVLKSFYQETVFAVAYLLGGWDHLRAMTKQFRSIDYDQQ